jgi:hypothetical protein
MVLGVRALASVAFDGFIVASGGFFWLCGGFDFWT